MRNWIFVAVLLLNPAGLHAEEFSIQVGDTIVEDAPAPGAGRIDTSTESDIYTFSGTAGQHVFFEEISAATSFAGWLQWEVKSPSGKSIVRTYFSGAPEGRRTLPETGIYTIKVSVGANKPDYVGNYSFRLREIPPDSTFTMEIGTTVTDGIPAAGAGRIELPGARDLYTFQAGSGDYVFVEEISSAKLFAGWLFWEVLSPDGKVLAQSYFDGRNEARVHFPAPGTYTLQVYARATNPSYVGEYSFRTIAVPPDQSFAIQIGDTVSDGVPGEGAGRIEATGAHDFYTFFGAAGQSVFFDAIGADPTFAGWLQWQVKTPAGILLVSDYFDGQNVGNRTLPETGTYSIRVAAGINNPGYVGAYSFRITASGADAPVGLKIGDLVSDGSPTAGAGNIEKPGSEDTFTLEATEGQMVVFEQINASPAFKGWLRWQILAPSGTELLAGYFKPGHRERKRLPETGQYTIRVFANTSDPESVGPYSFKTYCEVFALADTLATPPGQPLSIPVAKFLCNDRFESGDMVEVQLMGTTSQQGGALTQGTDSIMFTPKPGFEGIDTFAYVLRGKFGGESTGSVTVAVAEGVEENAVIVSTRRHEPSAVRVCLLGIPGQSYQVETSSDLQVWSAVETLTADVVGSMTYEYPTDAGHLFYRFTLRRPGE